MHWYIQYNGVDSKDGEEPRDLDFVDIQGNSISN